MSALGLERLADRCAHGWHPTQVTLADCACHDADEWAIFTAALRAAVRTDGSVHQCDVRPAIRGRIAPKHVGQLYRRARSLRLIRDTGLVEMSSDVEGRNADKRSRIYQWVGSAA